MKLKDNKGSITIFVLVGLLFMSAFLILSYANNVNKSKIAKEQFNILSSTYSYNDGDANAYNRAYTALRKKNVRIFSFENENDVDKTVFNNVSTIELTKTFEGKLNDYRIYGNTVPVGNQIKDVSDSNYGKYLIQIKVTNEDGSSSVTNDIYLSSPLEKTGTYVDYIDYEDQKVVREAVESDIKETKEIISLPEISIYEDYTKIEVVTDVEPSIIKVEYEGYMFEE